MSFQICIMLFYEDVRISVGIVVALHVVKSCLRKLKGSSSNSRKKGGQLLMVKKPWKNNLLIVCGIDLTPVVWLNPQPRPRLHIAWGILLHVRKPLGLLPLVWNPKYSQRQNWPWWTGIQTLGLQRVSLNFAIICRAAQKMHCPMHSLYWYSQESWYRFNLQLSCIFNYVRYPMDLFVICTK